MTASVDIQTQKKENVLSIPIEAVTTRSDSELNVKAHRTKAFIGSKNLIKEVSKLTEIVFIVEKSLSRVRKVKTGIQDNNFIEIVEGINPNDNIIIAPYSAISKKLKDSTIVQVVDKKDLFIEK
jgi:HlyD family secretion protein